MGHVLDRGDILDILEESVTSGRPIAVELRSNKRFVDQVSDVVTQDGQDWAIFKTHEPAPISDIHSCGRAEPWEPTYAGKR
jgi:Rho-binding antiterminator